MASQDGRFRILARLGAGGMGQAFLAERVAPSGDVQRLCVKRILDDEARTPEWIERFEREARLLMMLRHQNIVGLVELGTEGDTRWMALELVDGTDLRDLFTALRARGERLPVDVAVFVAAEIAVALSVAHEARDADGSSIGLVHRDVTPTNILLSHRGEVKLADFGIAKVTKSARTKTGSLPGKIPYMSPEHSLEREVDHRSDLFALGVVLFELIAGERPFDGRTWLATQLNVIEGRQKDLRALAPDAPEALVRLVDGMLASDPEKRTQTAYAVIDALRLLTEPYSAARHLGKLVTWCRPPWVVPSAGVLTEEEVGSIDLRG